MTALITQKYDDNTQYITPETHQYQKGILFLSGPIDSAKAEEICLALAANESKAITLVINSPGGSVSDGLAIIDTMRTHTQPVYTHVLGMAASMAALIAACGEPGHRTISPLSEIMIHQPLMYGAGGQASDIAIAAEAILRKKKKLNSLLAEATGKTIKEIEKATDRDTWLDAEAALKFGIVDAITPYHCADEKTSTK